MEIYHDPHTFSATHCHITLEVPAQQDCDHRCDSRHNGKCEDGGFLGVMTEQLGKEPTMVVEAPGGAGFGAARGGGNVDDRDDPQPANASRILTGCGLLRSLCLKST